MQGPSTPAALMELKAIALEAAANAVMITDREGRILWVNQAFTKLTGYTAEETIGQTPRILRSGHHDPEFFAQMWRTILAGEPWQGQVVNRRKDGSLYVEEQTITPVLTGGQVTHFIAIKRHITERKVHEEQFQDLTTHDALTGLPNRRALHAALDEAIARSAYGSESALLMLDMDNLKMINDSLGHSAGDKVLVGLAQRLKAHLHPRDFLARVAGDEFAILLHDAGMDQAIRTAQWLRQVVSQTPVTVNGENVFTTVSVGLVPVHSSLSVEQLLSHADAAMYQAKLRGGNRVQVVQPMGPHSGRLSAEFAAAQRVRQALMEGRLLLHYQPIVCLADRRAYAYESLLRLREPDGRIVSAGEFLSLAELAGFMNEIDRWVMEDTLRTLRDKPYISLTINVSGHAFNDEDLIGWLLDELAKLGSDAARLGLELTETAVIHDLNMARKAIDRLRRASVRVLLDDFGAGFNSFAYLRHLQVDGIKIDGGLVRDLHENERHRAMVRAITHLAEAFGLLTVAEGVEDAATASLLTDFGITCGQGYYFGRPQGEFQPPAG